MVDTGCPHSAPLPSPPHFQLFQLSCSWNSLKMCSYRFYPIVRFCVAFSGDFSSGRFPGQVPACSRTPHAAHPPSASRGGCAVLSESACCARVTAPLNIVHSSAFRCLEMTFPCAASLFLRLLLVSLSGLLLFSVYPSVICSQMLQGACRSCTVVLGALAPLPGGAPCCLDATFSLLVRARLLGAA